MGRGEVPATPRGACAVPDCADRAEGEALTVCIVQARATSSRLPGKVIAPIAGRPLIYHVLDRAAAIRGVDDLVVAIPNKELGTEAEQALEDALRDYGVTVVRGPEHDVLHRYVLAAEASKADIIMRITADCPLLSPEVAAAVVHPVKTSAAEYAWNDTAVSGFPDGLDVEAFTARALFEADRQLPKHHPDREHVTPALRRAHQPALVMNPDLLRKDVKLSVDTADDLALVRRIIGRLKPGHYNWVATKAAIREVIPDA